MIFPFGDLLKRGDAFDIYFCDLGHISQNTRRWRFNRPYDDVKSKQIANSMVNYTTVDGNVCICYLPGEGFVVFDGNNRVNASKFMDRQVNVVVHFYHFTTQNEVVRKFVDINKSEPCPSIYVRQNQEVKNIALAVQNRLYDKFPRVFSTNPNTKKPYTTKNKFMVTMEEFLDARETPVTSVDIFNKLMEYNEHLSVNNDAKPRTLKSCIKTGCYLFLDSDCVNSAYK
jgi:hypothetical protein